MTDRERIVERLIEADLLDPDSEAHNESIAAEVEKMLRDVAERAYQAGYDAEAGRRALPATFQLLPPR